MLNEREGLGSDTRTVIGRIGQRASGSGRMQVWYREALT